MQEPDPQNQDYHILATSSRADERTRVLKDGETFAVFTPAGSIRPGGFGELGIYHAGTRFISTFEVAIERRSPLLLSSTVRNDGVLIVHLANPDIPDFAGGALDKDALHLSSASLLVDGAWYARLELHNYSQRHIAIELAILYGADFRDVFEVRGMKRERRGSIRPAIIDPDGVTLGYDGLDGRCRLTRLELAPAPRRLTSSRAELTLRVEPGESKTVELRAVFGIDRLPPPIDYATAYAHVTRQLRVTRSARVETNNERFDAWIDRSASDVQMMTTATAYGPYPYAGVPWFSTPFGRDGIITAYERLWVEPDLARGVLGFLAATQATTNEPERDAEPGKIIHEARMGEMAALGEVPFGRYYGSVDATPLFVMLAHEHWRRTADRATVEELWPSISRALAWLETDGDCDGDGFVEYVQRTSRGLVSQGWKDSNDSISHHDGTLAEGPIALCEVQGYAYAAMRGAAELARVLGRVDQARDLEARADRLRERFHRAFWSERLGSYVLALDGNKRQCEVRASNAGHLLWCGIVEPSYAAAIVDTLFAPSSFTGWGIRTLDAGAARFNPISYHNGSVWPHDNALIAIGLARYGFKAECAKLLDSLFEASHYFELGRMPELFCGFVRRDFEGPTLYPVACAPQAWAAGSVFLILQACLGIVIDAPRRHILVDRPRLPTCIAQLALRDLQVGDATVDIVFDSHADYVSVHLERRTGHVELAVIS